MELVYNESTAFLGTSNLYVIFILSAIAYSERLPEIQGKNTNFV